MIITKYIIYIGIALVTIAFVIPLFVVKVITFNVCEQPISSEQIVGRGKIHLNMYLNEIEELDKTIEKNVGIGGAYKLINIPSDAKYTLIYFENNRIVTIHETYQITQEKDIKLIVADYKIKYGNYCECHSDGNKNYVWSDGKHELRISHHTWEGLEWLIDKEEDKAKYPYVGFKNEYSITFDTHLSNPKLNMRDEVCLFWEYFFPSIIECDALKDH